MKQKKADSDADILLAVKTIISSKIRDISDKKVIVTQHWLEELMTWLAMLSIFNRKKILFYFIIIIYKARIDMSG